MSLAACDTGMLYLLYFVAVALLALQQLLHSLALQQLLHSLALQQLLHLLALQQLLY